MAEKNRRDVSNDVVQGTLAEHRHCMEVVAEVEACLDRQPDRDGAWLSDLLRKLPKLSETLRDHFAAEEKGPLFEKIPYSHPQFASTLQDLKDEHGRITSTVESIIRKAGQLQDAEIFELRELNAQIQLLIATIRRHEAAENEVVVQAHWDEVGVGD